MKDRLDLDRLKAQIEGRTSTPTPRQVYDEIHKGEEFNEKEVDKYPPTSQVVYEKEIGTEKKI